MISFLFVIVVELKTLRNAYKLPRLIEQHDVISHEQKPFYGEFMSAATMKHVLVVM